MSKRCRGSSRGGGRPSSPLTAPATGGIELVNVTEGENRINPLAIVDFPDTGGIVNLWVDTGSGFSIEQSLSVDDWYGGTGFDSFNPDPVSFKCQRVGGGVQYAGAGPFSNIVSSP
jgi:hypothetical protein